MKRIAALLLAFGILFGFGQVAAAPVTSVAQADTYTSVRHVCGSSHVYLLLQTKWGANYYTRKLERCYNGPTGSNGGHVPTSVYVPGGGYCIRNNIYNNGVYVGQINYTRKGWVGLTPNRRNNIKIVLCDNQY